MERTRRLLAVIAVALLVVGAGCVGSGTSTDATPDSESERIVASSTSAIENVSTYQFTLSLSVETDDRTVAIESDGVVNLAEERMRMNYTQSSSLRTVETTQYIVGDTQYVEQFGMWRQRDVSDEDIWSEDNQMDRQRKLLADSAVTLAGNETVNGRSAYVLEIDPSDEVAQELAASGENARSDAEISDVTITQYVDHESDLPLKMTMDYEVEQDGDTAEAELVLTMSHFDEPTNITVPSAATSSA